MKRSEALKKIELVLADFYYQGPADTHDDAAADLVLTELEKLGMEPPSYPNKNRLPGESFRFTGWEPESNFVPTTDEDLNSVYHKNMGGYIYNVCEINKKRKK